MNCICTKVIFTSLRKHRVPVIFFVHLNRYTQVEGNFYNLHASSLHASHVFKQPNDNADIFFIYKEDIPCTLNV